MALKVFPSALGTSEQQIYLAAAGTEGAAHSITFSNVTTDPATYTLKYYHSSTETTHTIAADFPLLGQQAYRWPGAINMSAGDALYASASADSTVSAVVSVYENPSFAIGFTPRGTWDSVAQYYTNDVITYGGSSYVAMQPSIGASPTDPTYWQLFGIRGYTGSAVPVRGYTGSRGLVGYTGSSIEFRGYTGSQGPVGPTGTSPLGFRSISLPYPVIGTTQIVFYAFTTVTIGAIATLVRSGTGTPATVSYTVKYAASRYDVGTEVMVGGTTVHSDDDWVKVTSFSNNIVPAGSCIWVEVLSTAGSPLEFHLSVSAAAV